MFGKATVTLSDVTAGNGVVHAIDEVLFATPSMSTIGQNVFTENDESILTETSKNDDTILTDSFKNDILATRVLKKDNSFVTKKKNLVDLCRDLGYTSFAAAMTLTGIDKVNKNIPNLT